MSINNVAEALTEINDDQYLSADSINAEGHLCWNLEPTEQLQQLMFTGTLGNSYYVSQKDLTKRAKAFIEEQCRIRPEETINFAISGRNDGYIRTAPILALAVLSKYDSKLFKENFSKIIKTGNDLSDFILFIRSLNRGFGRSIKSAINSWILKNTNPFYAMKYTKQIGDAIRIARPKTNDPIFDYILNFKKQNVKNFEESLEKYPTLKGYEKAKQALSDGKWKKVVDLIEKYKLDPYSLIGVTNPPKDVWIELSKQMGTKLYLGYLNKLLREDAFKQSIMEKKLTVNNLIAAKIFPFRLFTTYNNLQTSFKSEIIKNHLSTILDQYGNKYNWGIWNTKKFVIAPDVSGSMTHGISKPSPAVIAGMISGFLYKFTKNSILLPWDTDIKLEKVLPKNSPVLSHIKSLSDAHGAGTFMEAPIRHMIKNNIHTDIYICITDSMEWGNGWLNDWVKYKNIFPNSKAVMIRVDQNPQKPFGNEHAHTNNIYQIYGYNNNVINWIEHVVLKD